MKNSLTFLPFAKSANVLFFGKELHFRQSFSQLMVFHKFSIEYRFYLFQEKTIHSI